MTPDEADLVARLKAFERNATPAPWTLATAVGRGEDNPIPIGIVGGCEIKRNPRSADDLTHNCADEDSPCVVVEFARVHLNDSRKPPLHPDNADSMADAKFIAESRTAMPALLDLIERQSKALDVAEAALMGVLEAYSIRRRNQTEESPLNLEWERGILDIADGALATLSQLRGKP